jgi:hypothetical protein
MTTIKIRKSNQEKPVNWLFFIIILLFFGAICWIVYFFRDEKNFTVLKLYGEGTAFNLSKNFNLTQYSSGIKNKGALLAEKGDILGFNNMAVFFKNVQYDSMQVDDNGDSLVFVNGKLNGIVLSRGEELLPWFRNMKPADIASLETIYFNAIVPDSYAPYLKEIARLKPNTSLSFEEDDSLNIMESNLSHADMFSPGFVMASLSQDKLRLLSRWKKVECLYLNISDSFVTTSLPAIPSLKQCIVYGDDLQYMVPSFFSNNKQLKKITLIAKLNDYTLLQPLAGLEELAINTANRAMDLAELKNSLPKLSVFIVSGRCSNIDLLASHKKLRWLGLPENTSQQQFNNITSQLQDLQVLELQGGDSVNNFATLQQLPNLRGLVITDTVTDKKSLHAMKDLRYLSIPTRNKEDSAFVLAMEKALPGCIIVPNNGACLGSGWMLLLIPVVLLSGYFIYGMKGKLLLTNNHATT